MALIIPTCETAVSTLPEWHRAAFAGKEELLSSQAGWSPGALNLAQGVAMKLHAQLIHNEMSQLLIDLSCDPTDPARWSAEAMMLTEDQRQKLDQRQKTVYLTALDTRITTAAQRKETAIHISFDTRPGLDHDWAIIEHDPRSTPEANFAAGWRIQLLRMMPDAVIRNSAAPTRSMSAYLRNRYPGLLSLRFIAAQSSFMEGHPIAWSTLKKSVISSLHELR